VITSAVKKNIAEEKGGICCKVIKEGLSHKGTFKKRPE
jgi:hypothetical protein